MKEPIKKLLIKLVKPLTTIIFALLIGIILILPTKTSPLEAYKVLFEGAFGNLNRILNTLARSTPLLFTGLAAAFAFKGGIFNIGVEGQMYMGGLAAALTGIYLKGLPGFVLLPLCLLAAMVAGLGWAYIQGILKTKFKINIIIASIMLNNIAILFTSYLVTYPFKGELPLAATAKIADGAMLPRFSIKSELNAGFIIGLVVAIILYFVIYKTKFGYETRAIGLNENFTKYMGVNIASKTMIVLFISGMIGGLAGAEQIMGVNYRFLSGFSPGYGFTGITVALLGGLHPIGIILGAIFFGALTNGAVHMEVMTNISRDLINSFQAIIIMLLAAEQLIKFSKLKKIKRKGMATNDGVN